MKRGRPSGWQLRNNHEIPPPTPTRWERFCGENGIDNPMAALRNGKRKMIHEWVQKHCDSAYIPADVLELLDCKTRWES